VAEVSDALRQLLADVFAPYIKTKNFRQELTRNPRSAHELCEKHNDVATASLIENWTRPSPDLVLF